MCIFILEIEDSRRCEGCTLPDQPVAVPSQINIYLGQPTSLKCIFNNPNATENIKATFIWTNNYDASCCQGGEDGNLLYFPSSACYTEFYCTPVNECGEGPNTRVTVKYTCEYTYTCTHICTYVLNVLNVLLNQILPQFNYFLLNMANTLTYGPPISITY